MSEASTGSTSDNEQQARAAHEERHASWLELFCDLIVAAGVAQIADRLRAAPHRPTRWPASPCSTRCGACETAFGA